MDTRRTPSLKEKHYQGLPGGDDRPPRETTSPRTVSWRTRSASVWCKGGNNKIRVLQRRAYCYRDENYLNLKIVAAFLPPSTRNVENDPL
jgi:hypothetical protein